MFCDGTDHYVRNCQVAEEYIRQNKLTRDQSGRLVFPDGQYPSRNLPGRNLKERVDSYWSGRRDQSAAGSNYFGAVETNFLEGISEGIFSIDVTPGPKSSSDSSDLDDEIQLAQARLQSLMEAQAFALQKGKKERFDGVEVPPRPKRSYTPPPANGNAQRHSSRDKSSTPFTREPPPHQNAKPSIESSQQRPQGPMKPVFLPPKPTDDKKHHYQSPVESSVKASELADRALDTKITISTRELLAASSDVRKHVKELVTNKKVSFNVAVDDSESKDYSTLYEHLAPPSADLDVFEFESTSRIASPSLPLRVIYPTFGPGVEPECILDGGSQIIVMRRDVWEKLHVPLAAAKCRKMESANAGKTMTMGEIEDHPVKIGPITVRLQIQVVEEAPFEVLLGRPFFDVLNCVEISRSGGEHMIRVRDPKTGDPYVFTTTPRDRSTIKDEAANFRV